MGPVKWRALVPTVAILAFGALLPSGTLPESKASPGIVRALIADAAWLAGDLAWERRDTASTRQWLGVAVAADPTSDYFWVNGARMLAFDLPTWEDAQRPWWRAYRRRLGAREALAWLERGRTRRGESFAINVEMGNIALYGLGDRTLAAQCYRRAAASPDRKAYADSLARKLARDAGPARLTR
ncbi:MAG TPA: hypothetical protein VHD32_18525 [Candidatus Didemnitutus sp.]|nr:hypothetical protein [Candidatus Didemnitutus sp.]